MRPYRFHAHEKSDAHVDSVLRLINPTQCELASHDLPTAKSVPITSQFITLLQWLRRGGGIRDGIPCVGSYRKLRRMVFTLAEGLKRVYRKWLRTATTINLLRDERHSRLLVRFRCGDLKGVRHIGILGQARMVSSTATNNTIATKNILEKFCTRNYGGGHQRCQQNLPTLSSSSTTTSGHRYMPSLWTQQETKLHQVRT